MIATLSATSLRRKTTKLGKMANIFQVFHSDVLDLYPSQAPYRLRIGDRRRSIQKALYRAGECLIVRFAADGRRRDQLRDGKSELRAAPTASSRQTRNSCTSWPSSEIHFIRWSSKARRRWAFCFWLAIQCIMAEATARTPSGGIRTVRLPIGPVYHP